MSTNGVKRRTETKRYTEQILVQPRRHGYVVFGQLPTRSDSTVKTGDAYEKASFPYTFSIFAASFFQIEP